jgi:hypothetical protein
VTAEPLRANPTTEPVVVASRWYVDAAPNHSGCFRRSRSARDVISSFSHRGRRPLPVVEAPQQLAASRVVDGTAVVRVDERQVHQLGALVDVRHPRHRELHELLGQHVGAERRCQLGHELGDRRAQRLVGQHLLGVPLTAWSYAGSGVTQAVCRFASRVAFSRYAPSRAASIGQAPTSVCHRRYSVLPSGQPSGER